MIPEPAQETLAASNETPAPETAAMPRPAPELAPPAPHPEDLLKSSVAWASECGLSGPFVCSGPVQVNFPKHGHGYSVTVQEADGKRRMGTAMFNSVGKRTIWTMDSLLSG